MYGYNKCMNFLRLKARPDLGLTCILAPKWMYMSVLSNPYSKTDGNPIYLDGFSFAGLVSLQTVSSTWPATAGYDNDEISILQALETSTYVPSVMDDPEEKELAKDESEVELGAASSNKGGLSERSNQ